MPSKESIDNGSFDDLLGEDLPAAEVKTLVDLKDAGEPGPTPEQVRIAELEAKLAAAEEKAKTPEKSIEQKNLEHGQTVKATRELLNAPEKFEDIAEDADTVVIHFLDDGFTFGGRVWYGGQTVSFPKSGLAYQDTLDREGESWLDHLTPKEQYARWGRQRVGFGPWPGQTFNDSVAAEDEKRGTAAPIITL